MKSQVVFKCKVTGYYIEYIIDTDLNHALMNVVVTDYKHVKAFLALMRNSINNLKRRGVKRIRQFVSIDEWTKFLKNKTSWKVLNEMDPYEIECDIDDFMTNYGIGIGFGAG